MEENVSKDQQVDDYKKTPQQRKNHYRAMQETNEKSVNIDLTSGRTGITFDTSYPKS